MICQQVDGRWPVPGGFLIEGPLWVVYHVPTPAVIVGWLVISLRRHCVDFARLTDAEARAYGLVALRVGRAVQEVLAPERIYLCQISEIARHVHASLVPRGRELPPERRSAALLAEQYEVHASGRHEGISWAEAEAAAARLRVHLAAVPQTDD
jgi:diadenosine tetraphosphate (Ap4A) HIT family hydrolase